MLDGQPQQRDQIGIDHARFEEVDRGRGIESPLVDRDVRAVRTCGG